MKTKTTVWVTALAAAMVVPAGAWAQPVGGLPPQVAPQAQAQAAAGPAPAAAANDVSAEAFGVQEKQGGAPGQDKTPLAALAPGGPRLVEAEHGPFASPPGLAQLKTNAMGVSTTGVVGKNASTAQGRSTLSNIDVLSGLVKAEQVTAVSSSASNGRKASSNALGSQILGLVINGVAMGDLTPAPNTSINLPGIGEVILNEQLPTGDRIKTSGLQVNMIHLVQKDPLTGAAVGDIIVGSATSAARFTR
jgi:hypothetical protein